MAIAKSETRSYFFFFSFFVIIHLSHFLLETVYVIRDMGIQLNRKRFIGFESHYFIEKSKISSIVINEGITYGDIVFYLAIVIHGQNKMTLVFEVALFILF
jgi:hypothetical protein